MDLFSAIVLGILQGITEWLPISSSAMVTLFGKLIFNFDYSDALGTALWLHCGTTLAAVIYFRQDILNILKSVYNKDKENKQIFIFLLITTIFSFIIAGILSMFLFSIQIPDSIFTLGIGFFLLIIAFLHKNRKESEIKEKVTDIKAIIVGFFQGISVLPGISRSGITIAVLLYEKFSLKDSFRLSFLMSIPVTFGASLLIPVIKEGFIIDEYLILSGIIAFITGLLTIKILMDFAEKVNFYKATLFLGLFVLLFGVLQLLI
ncbi:MAG: undecaprenyl-diphosphate phosphatase [Candidatus Micrarchaeia archaeon]|jgi:undecaprenyl-diphosphatase